MVLITVAIRILNVRFHSPVDIVSSGPWTKPLLEGQIGVGDVYLLRSRKSPFFLTPDQQRLVHVMRERGVAATWLFDVHNDKVRWLLARAGWQPQDFVSQEELDDIPREHFCDRWRRFALIDPPRLRDSRLELSGVCQPELRLRPEVRSETANWLRALGLAGRPFILMQVGNKRTMRRGDRRRRSNTKYWPEERWAAVLSSLRVLHPDHALLMLGVPAEATLNDEILAMASVEGAYNVARQMTVPRLMGLAELATGMISVDTGPAHVAAALGCPVLTMFDSSEKANMYAPRGPNSERNRVLISTDVRPSLFSISTERVLAAWREMSLVPERRADSDLEIRVVPKRPGKMTVS
jgi:heptosyltransferase-2/heptosyltransferase-3